ncbi:CHASE3 domain-containing protein [Gloeobacter kilaueensis]|uniref:Multi-sensor signal transduction histidine kinase n=1 Tax=Gloeobacter kilaueensis (strain ATCC BAA-2537 / CCAP 1431/1 / ULC 316 / JS1) TaxID=1183438 RepID=U5QDX3_GLOK1|nr:CHASE3 domain-containing protein [Gloeobacter kilaueensis]AGY57162.1 multi-sensor signal transduction histidine kinase [Gloeobacter kilaueensis JS1]
MISRALIAAGYGLLLAAAPISLALAWDSLKWVEHTLEVRLEIDRCLKNLLDAETGTRGYVITGDDEFLEPYRQAVGDAVPCLSRLAVLTADNPYQQGLLAVGQRLCHAKLEIMAGVIKARRTRGFEAAQRIVASKRGKAAMDGFRYAMARMFSEESRLLAERQQRLAIGLTAGCLVTASALAGLLWLKFKDLRVQKLATEAVASTEKILQEAHANPPLQTVKQSLEQVADRMRRISQG